MLMRFLKMAKPKPPVDIRIRPGAFLMAKREIP
jgi:hypothetical protein